MVEISRVGRAKLFNKGGPLFFVPKISYTDAYD